VRKGDLELLEMRLEPHSAAIDRLTSDMGQWLRVVADLKDRVKDIERNDEIRKTEIAQGLASIRSLLQRANKAARDTGIVEDEEDLAVSQPAVNTPRTADQIIADARAKHGGRTVL